MDEPRDRDEQLTYEALRKVAGDPDRAQAYLEWSEKRRRMIDEHERRISALEAGMEATRAKLSDMASEARETRAEQGALLRQVAARVETIAKDQTLEAGRRQGWHDALAETKETGRARQQWMLVVVPAVLALALWAAGRFVLDVVATTQGAVAEIVAPEGN